MTTSSPPPVRPRPDAPQQPPGRRRSWARTAVPLVIALCAVLEIWLMIVVAGATSGLTVLLLLLAGFVLGAAAVKRAGRSAWRNLAASVSAQQAGQEPAPPEGGGRTGLAMLGGLLLIIPGFISDAVALFLLFPPTRKVIGRLADRAAARALRSHGVPVPPDGFPPPPGGPATPPQGDGKVIQGEVINRE